MTTFNEKLPAPALATELDSNGGDLTSLVEKDLTIPYEYSVRQFGAKGDGETNDTEAVQRAIDTVSQTGGRLVFPPGVYRTGMIQLKSGICIHLVNQAVWKAIPDLALYPRILDCNMPAFIFAENESDITLSGEGKIHGCGDAHEVFLPASDSKKKGLRPFGFLLRDCRNVTVTGLTLESSAYWMFRAVQCDDMMLRGLRVFNSVNYNNDGFDIVDCHRVTISDCILDCEDDAICPKSESGRGVEDLTVTNCVISSHANAIKFGWMNRGGFNRIVISNCVIRPSRFRKTLHPMQLIDGIAGISITSGDGGNLTDVLFNNIVMDGVQAPIFVRLGNRNAKGSRGSGVAEKPGVVDGITFSNIRATNVGPVASSFSAYPGTYVNHIRFLNVDIISRLPGTAEDAQSIPKENSNLNPGPYMYESNMPAYGLFLRHVKNITLDQVFFRAAEGEARPEIYMSDAHGVTLDRVRCERGDRRKPEVITLDCTDIVQEN